MAAPEASPRLANGRARILVRGVNWLGDAVMTTPGLQRLREALPGAHITLLTRQSLEALWQHHPSVDSVLPLIAGESPMAVARRLKPERFDAALLLPNSLRSALETWLAGIPVRIGYDRRGGNWLLTQAVPKCPGHFHTRKRPFSGIQSLMRTPGPQAAPPGTPHQTQEYLHLGTALGASAAMIAPKLVVTVDEEEQARQRVGAALAGKGIPRRGLKVPILLGINPGAEFGPAKRWPVETFAAAIREVSRRLGGCVWLAFGGKADWRRCEDLARGAGGTILNLAGQTSLRELMSMVKICRVVLTNDTGPMHVAGALGTPVVVLFGSTSPQLTGPGLPGDPRNVLFTGKAGCSPCFRRVCPIDFRCMATIPVSRVVQAVIQTVSEREGCRSR